MPPKRKPASKQKKVAEVEEAVAAIAPATKDQKADSEATTQEVTKKLKKTATSGAKEPSLLHAKGQIQSAFGTGVFPSGKIVISSWNINGLRAVLKKGEMINYL